MRCSKTRLSVAKAFNQTVIALAPPPLPTSRQSQPPVATTTTTTSGDSAPAAAGVLTEYRDTVCVTAPFVQVTTSDPLPIPIASYPSAPFLLRPTDIYTPFYQPTLRFAVLEHHYLWVHAAVEPSRAQQADQTVPEHTVPLRRGGLTS